jgi:hypothetical protein
LTGSKAASGYCRFCSFAAIQIILIIIQPKYDPKLCLTAALTGIYVVLHQKNIEAVCSSEAEIRDQIRRTVIHELGHYVGMDEDQLKDILAEKFAGTKDFRSARVDARITRAGHLSTMTQPRRQVIDFVPCRRLIYSVKPPYNR